MGLGASGKDLLKLLLEDKTIEQVDVFVRRPLDLMHKKLKIHLFDFDRMEEWKNQVQGDVLFSCLGTTLRADGSKQAQ